MKEKVEMSLERFIELMNDKAELERKEIELEDLLDMLFENTRLSLTGDDLWVVDEFKVLHYLEARYRNRYNLRLTELKSQIVKEEEKSE